MQKTFQIVNTILLVSIVLILVRAPRMTAPESKPATQVTPAAAEAIDHFTPRYEKYEEGLLYDRETGHLCVPTIKSGSTFIIASRASGVPDSFKKQTFTACDIDRLAAEVAASNWQSGLVANTASTSTSTVRLPPGAKLVDSTSAKGSSSGTN